MASTSHGCCGHALPIVSTRNLLTVHTEGQTAAGLKMSRRSTRNASASQALRERTEVSRESSCSEEDNHHLEEGIGQLSLPEGMVAQLKRPKSRLGTLGSMDFFALHIAVNLVEGGCSVWSASPSQKHRFIRNCVTKLYRLLVSLVCESGKRNPFSLTPAPNVDFRLSPHASCV